MFLTRTPSAFNLLKFSISAKCDIWQTLINTVYCGILFYNACRGSGKGHCEVFRRHLTVADGAMMTGMGDIYTSHLSGNVI